MSVNSYDQLREHVGHKIACVCYGLEGEHPVNAALECETCHEVLLEYERGEEVPEFPTFAGIDWCAEDVQTVFHVDTELAEAFLSKNESKLRERMTELGWGVIELFGALENLPPVKEEEDGR